MTYFRPRHYTTALITDLRAAQEGAEAKKQTLIAKTIQGMIGGYTVAPKFLLPDNGILFEDKDLTRYLGLLRLPFKEVVLEYAGYTGPFDDTPSGDEIDSCLLAVEDVEPDGDPEKDKPTRVHLTVCYKPRNMSWSILPIHIVLPYDMTTESFMSDGIPYGVLPGFEGKYDKVQLRKMAQIALKESISLFQFCAAIACGNVRSEEIKAPRFINQQRKAKGKPPLFSYHVLTVDVGVRTEHGDSKGGTHASPRQHLRRGHIRQYKSGLTIWINSMVVGDKKLGRVDKDYIAKVHQ